MPTIAVFAMLNSPQIRTIQYCLPENVRIFEGLPG
jgi:hypothetical protein